VEPATKFEPLTVRVNVGPPAGAVVGFRLVIVGDGGAVMATVELLEASPFAVTVTTLLPGEAIKAAATEAVN